MNLIRLTAVLLLLVMYCAERISPTDSAFDPDNKGGNYGFTYTVGTLTRAQLPTGKLSVFVRYSLSCQLEEQKDPLIGYHYRFDPVDNAAGARPFASDTGFRETLKLYFTGQYNGNFTVVALKPNGDEISLTDSIHVINPFRIDTATGWMKREGSIGAAVVGRIGAIPKELETDKFMVLWLRNGVAADTVTIAAPCTLGVQDTTVLSAIIYEKDNPNVSLPPDSIVVIARSSGKPEVRFTDMAADNIKNVQVNEPDTIRVTYNFADSIFWVYNGTSRPGTLAYFVYTPADTAGQDTLIVFVKNRFGLVSDTDTVFIKAGTYPIRLNAQAAMFPLSIVGRTWNSWGVEAEAANIRPDSIRYRWTISPRSAIDSIRDSTGPTLRLYCNPNRDVDSFTLKVVAFAGADSSLTIGRQVMVRRYRPAVILKSSTDTCNLYDTARFTFTVSDNVKVDSVWYRSDFNGNTPRLLKDSTLALLCTAAGERIVKFWCVDDSRYTSDTVRAMVNVRSDSCYFKRNDTAITVFAGAPARITAPEAYPGSAAFSSIVKWMWDLDTNGVFDKETDVNYFDTVFTTPGTSVMRVGCRNNKGSNSITNAKITITVKDGAPVVDSVYGVKTTAFIRDKVTLRIKASDGDGTVEKLIVIRNPAGDTAAVITVTPPAGRADTTVGIIMNDVDSCSFSVVAIDNNGKQSPPAMQINSMVVSAGRPAAIGVTPETCWMLQDTIFTVAATDAPGDSDLIRSVSIQWEIGGAWQDTASLSVRHTYTTSGMKKIRVVVFDTTNMASDTLADSVFVKQGRPSATVTVDSALTWINDTIQCVVHAADANGAISGRFIRWDSDSGFVRLGDSTGRHWYRNATVHTISAYSVDNDGLSSDTASITVNVRLGQPSASVRGDTIPWVNDSITMTVSAADQNGAIAARYIRWDNNGNFTRVTDSTAGYRYGTIGSHTISAFSIDNDSIRSDTAKLTIRVRKGAPTITSVVLSRSVDSIYINDNVSFRVTVLDSNDRNDKVKVSWVNSTTYTDSATIAVNDTVSFTRQFARLLAGSVSVRFKVTDADGFSDSTVVTFQVKSGAPAVSLLSINPAPGTIYVNDPVTFRFRASDGNGQIRKVYVNWQGGNTPDNELTFSPGAASIDSAFSHTYDTTGGVKHIRIWTIDEDTIQSAVLDTGVLIRKCPPVLWGDAGDTLWVVVNNGVGINKVYPIRVNSYDTNSTNGQVGRFYWNSSNTLTGATITTTDTIMPVFTSLTPFDLYIFGKDEDSLVSNHGKFIVFPDSAPAKPTIVAAGGSGAPVNIAWSGKDAKDGNQTQYAILLRKGSAPGAGDTLVTYRAGSTFDSGTAYSNDFKYTFTPSGGTGTYYYRIIARDARGTRSESDNGTFYY